MAAESCDVVTIKRNAAENGATTACQGCIYLANLTWRAYLDLRMEIEMSESGQEVDYIQITADIVAAFVSNNSVRASELPTLIEAVHGSLWKVTEIKV